MSVICRVVFSSALWMTCFQIAFGQSWEWLNPLPTNRDLRTVRFVNHSVGWVAGEDGTILKTHDGGASWSFQECGIRRQITLLDVIDEFNVCAVATSIASPNSPSIAKSSDGGESWVLLDSPEREDGYIYTAMEFVTAEFGWVLGDSAYFTSDGGVNWTARAWPSQVTSAIHPIGFGTDTLHCVRSNYYLRTTDRAENWYVVELDSGFRASELVFSDANLGWITGIFPGPDPIESRVYRTTDGGNTWQSWSTNELDHLVKIVFANANFGWAIGSGPGIEGTEVVRTENGGESWEPTGERPESELFWDWTFLNADSGWFVGSLGVVYRSIDGGVVWDSLSHGFRNTVEGMAFTDQNHGWIVTEDFHAFSTENGGIDWNPSDLPVDDHYEDISFSGQHGVITTFESGILYTHDLGISWVQVVPNVPDTFYYGDVLLATDQVGYVSSGGGLFLRSLDGGVSWDLRNIGFDPHPGGEYTSVLFNPFFVSAFNGWMLGGWFQDFSLNREHHILHTADGDNWISQFESTTVDLNSLFFFNNLHGWVTGREFGNGVVLTTLDGGETWEEIWRSDLYPTSSDVLFVNDNEGWIVGSDTADSGVILHTTDGGVTWGRQQIPRTSSLTHLAMADSNNLFAAGNEGGLLHLNRFPDHISRGRPLPANTQIQLAAYPNPFNGSLSLSFYLPMTSIAQLCVYNVSGRLVETIQSGVAISGWHNSRLSSSRLASGAYFVRLSTPEQSAIQRVIVVR